MKRILILALPALLAACALDPADERLSEAVSVNIHQVPGLAVDALQIHSENGVVYIHGLVSTHLEYVEVERIAKATKGVKQVVNMTAVDNQRL